MHEIIHGDCREVMKGMDESSVHLIVTDPPYFIEGLDDTWKKGKKKPYRTRKGKRPVVSLAIGMKFDPEQGHKLQTFIRNTGTQMIRVLMPGSFCAVFSQPRLSHRMAIGLEEAGFEIRDMYTWNYTKNAQIKAFSMDHFVDKMDIPNHEKRDLKNRMDGKRTPQLQPQFETIILAQKPKEGTHIENWLKYETGLANIHHTLPHQSGHVAQTTMPVEKPGKDPTNTHPTVKPIRIIEHLIQIFSSEGQTVLDPFLGSGTTSIAALYRERNSIGVEQNEEYVEIAKRRFEEAQRIALMP